MSDSIKNMFSEETWDKLSKIKDVVVDKITGRKQKNEEQKYDYLENSYDV